MLSINISELIWTIINFFLLYFLLKKFLYTPLIRFMDERKARMDAGGEAMKEAEAQLSEKNAELETLRLASLSEAQGILDAARAEDEQLRSEADERLRVERETSRKQGMEELDRLRETSEAELDAETTELAGLLVDRLLSKDSKS